MGKKVYGYCPDCGAELTYHLRKRCTICANLIKAKVADGKCKESTTRKVIKMSNGMTVLNNVFGLEISSNGSYNNY